MQVYSYVGTKLSLSSTSSNWTRAHLNTQINNNNEEKRTGIYETGNWLRSSDIFHSNLIDAADRGSVVTIKFLVLCKEYYKIFF